MTQSTEWYHRPPSEADSFIIRVAHGCPHNKCTFCTTFKNVQYRQVPIEDVLAGIEKDAKDYGNFLHLITSIYLEGGDPIALNTQDLLCIMRYARNYFPFLTRFGCYATALSIVHKSREELRALAQAGLRRVFVGLESGLDAILQYTHKGCTAADLLRAGELLADAGIENDVSMMLGIGGVELSEQHAIATADLLNAVRPVCVRIRTFTPRDGTPLAENYRKGSFTLPEPHETLKELRLLVQNIHSPMQLLSEHWTAFVKFEAMMPMAKEALLQLIDRVMQEPRSAFRETGVFSAQGTFLYRQ